MGVSAGGEHRAYPLPAFSPDPARIEEELGEKSFVLVHDPAAPSIRIEGAEEGVEWMYAFWFAWAAFHPQTEIWSQ